MPKLLERRRKPRRKAAHVTGPTWVMLESVPGARADVRAKVVDFNETGMRIHVSLLLRVNHIVVVKCQAASVVPNGKAHARVVDCRALGGTGYAVGLTFEKTIGQNIYEEAPARAGYRILSPGAPEKRAQCDLEAGANGILRLRVFDPSEAAAVKESEKSKRRGILELLYAARRSQPGLGTVSLHELEELLGCTREHLDFSLWYLKENALLVNADSGHYSITAKGVDHVEAEVAARPADQRLLAAGE